MKQTPIHNNYNPDLLTFMPKDATRVVEVGCSSGALARAFLAHNPGCEYIGLEIDADYAEVAKSSCSRVLVGNIEHMDDATFNSLVPAGCWVFGDVLEHLYDPWAVLRRIRASMAEGASVVACIPNAQHWSIQVRINNGLLRYEDSGLLDRTHIRWFTRTTIHELFAASGFRVVQEHPRIFAHPHNERALAAVKAMAQAIGGNAEEAARNAAPLQWVVRAVAC